MNNLKDLRVKMGQMMSKEQFEAMQAANKAKPTIFSMQATPEGDVVPVPEDNKTKIRELLRAKQEARKKSNVTTKHVSSTPGSTNGGISSQ